MNIIVLKTEGKGKERPTHITIMSFGTKKDANAFCKENTNLDNIGPKDYWSFSEIVQIGSKYEPWHGENIEINKPHKSI